MAPWLHQGKAARLRPVEIKCPPSGVASNERRHREAIVVAASYSRKEPLSLVVTGEAESWLPALEQIVGPQWLEAVKVTSDGELFEVVQSGVVDAAVLDDGAQWDLEVLQVLRIIRRLDALLPVVVVTRRTDRRLLADAMRLAAFSVVVKPLELEELLRQIQRIMVRLDEMLRDDVP